MQSLSQTPGPAGGPSDFLEIRIEPGVGFCTTVRPIDDNHPVLTDRQLTQSLHTGSWDFQYHYRGIRPIAY